jgi:Zn-dependent protease with chaperone function
VNEDKASRYHRLRRRSTVASAVLVVLALVALLPFGGSRVLRDAAMSVTGSGPSAVSTVAAYVLLLTLAHQMVALPLAFYQSFLLERRYGLSSEPFRAWVADHLKAAALLAVLGLAGGEIVYLTLRWLPRWWWMASAICFIIAVVGMAKVAPTVLLPLFYRLKPLDRESLQEKLVELSTRASVPVLGVYEWGLGAKTRRANAALVGTGSTRRILLSDTLLADYTDEEIEVILAHELGHHVNRDIRTALMLESGLIAASFAIAAMALVRLGRPLGLEGSADVAGLPVLLAAGALLSLAVSPALNAISRRNERRADEFALSLTAQPSAFMTAMRRLATQNLAEERPSRAALWLFHTHPTLDQRIETARRFELQRT